RKKASPLGRLVFASQSSVMRRSARAYRYWRQKQSARLEKSSKWKRSRKRLSSSAKTDANSSSSSQEAAVCLTSQLDQLVNGLTGWLEGVVVLGRRNTKQKQVRESSSFRT